MSDGERGGNGGAARSLTSEEAFALLGDETRAAIVRALGDARGRAGPPATLSFSGLRERVDPDIDTGQFNYHLQRLVGRFVARTDEGYRLRPEGTRLYRTVLAGTFTRTAPPVSFGMDAECFECSGPLRAEYADGMFSVRCPACDALYDDVFVPPHVVEATDREELLALVDAYHRHRLRAFTGGVCPVCVNPLETRLLRADETPLPASPLREVTVHRSCGHCGAMLYLSVGEALLHHPALVSFCYERGRDVTTVPLWELAFAKSDRGLSVRSASPWEVERPVACGGDELRVVVDGDLNVVETEIRG